MQTYREAAQLGEWAVEKVAAFYLRQGDYVVDVQGDKFFQSLDVDLLLTFADTRREVWVEVKADTYKTGNVYLETVSNVELATPGCITYTQADWLVYYFVNQGYAVVFGDVEELQAWMTHNLHRFMHHEVTNNSANGRYLFRSEGYTVPTEVLMNEIVSVWVMKNLPVWNKEK